MKKRTFNTLFMLSSVDGKISTGKILERDVDKDYSKIKGLKEGLHQYYDLEKRTDFCSFNTGLVMAKIGVNTDHSPINVQSCSFVILDGKHLTKNGVQNLINGTKKLYLVTTNKKHPAFEIRDEKLVIIHYPKQVDFSDLFEKLRSKYGVKRITVQSGGTLNSILIREGLIDRVSLVIAPALIGGKETPSLVDGDNLISERDLKNIKSLKLLKVNKLKKSYLHLIYQVL